MSAEQRQLNALIEKLRSNDTSLDSMLVWARYLCRAGRMLGFTLFYIVTDRSLICRL